jgi:hypothetical protein
LRGTLCPPNRLELVEPIVDLSVYDAFLREEVTRTVSGELLLQPKSWTCGELLIGPQARRSDAAVRSALSKSLVEMSRLAPNGTGTYDKNFFACLRECPLHRRNRPAAALIALTRLRLAKAAGRVL